MRCLRRPTPPCTYRRFEDIPPVIVNSLLFIENREILDADTPYRNPSVEWPRLAGAVFDVGLNLVYPAHRISGGSTLATQIEKMRYSPGGATASAGEKIRQMVSASLRAYGHGEETMEARKRIVGDYLNGLPLAATAGHGEVHGLGDGLWAWYGADFDAVNQSACPARAGVRRRLRAAGTRLPAGAQPAAGGQQSGGVPGEGSSRIGGSHGHLSAGAGQGRRDPGAVERAVPCGSARWCCGKRLLRPL